MMTSKWRYSLIAAGILTSLTSVRAEETNNTADKAATQSTPVRLKKSA